METSAQPRNLSRETLGKFFYDLAKIVFTALVFYDLAKIVFTALVTGSLVTMVTMQALSVWHLILIVVGIASTFVLARIGNNLIIKS